MLRVLLPLAALAAPAAAAAAAAAAQPQYTVHALATAARPAAWQRTKCGSYHNLSAQPDLITQWGATVSPATPPLCEYPRPQMTRPSSTMTCLNGLWEYQLAAQGEAPPFNTELNQTILVPFPLESCLSGAFRWPEYSPYMFYRLLFDAPAAGGGDGVTLLHFGAVDYNASVYLNGALLGAPHAGGYDGFSFVLPPLLAANNELIVAVHDPSDKGVQVEGKQRVSAIDRPGGDTYTPSSGIWQTVWLESVAAFHVSGLRVRGDAANLYISASTYPNVPGSLSVAVSLAGAPVATAAGATFEELVIPIPSPSLWHPDHPTLYDIALTATEPSTGASDTVGSYQGLRSVGLVTASTPPVPASGPRVGWDNHGGDLPGQPTELPAADYTLCWALCNQTAGCVAWSYGSNATGCNDGPKPKCWLKGATEGWSQNVCRTAGDQGSPGQQVLRPAINGEFTFLAGWLDQSWWSDGEYTAPTDEALRFDLQAVKDLGLNAVRLHQKVNSERWYYHADVLGVVVLQDMPQKYGGATEATVAPFLAELKAMIDGRGNHPSIVQWDLYNEGDCVGVFNASEVVQWAQAYDPHRLIDTNSGGPANNLHIGDVNDIHSYPWPGSPRPSATQYAMVGEFGGIGAFTPGAEWSPGQCYAYLANPTPEVEAETYVNMTQMLMQGKDTGVSVSIFTQLSGAPSRAAAP